MLLIMIMISEQPAPLKGMLFSFQPAPRLALTPQAAELALRPFGAAVLLLNLSHDQKNEGFQADSKETRAF